MKANSLPDPRPAPAVACLLAALLTGPALEASIPSHVVTSALDAGGGAGSSASYSSAGHFASPAGSGTSVHYIAASGFIAQIIEPPKTILEMWRSTYFGNATTKTGDQEDFDNDGIPNILEFAFGTDPGNLANGSPSLQYSGTFAGGGELVATGQPITRFENAPSRVDFRAVFVRRKNAGNVGVSYVPQFSATLGFWQTSTAVPTVLADDGTFQVVSVPYPLFVGGRKARFFRIGVSVAP